MDWRGGRRRKFPSCSNDIIGSKHPGTLHHLVSVILRTILWHTRTVDDRCRDRSAKGSVVDGAVVRADACLSTVDLSSSAYRLSGVNPDPCMVESHEDQKCET